MSAAIGKDEFDAALQAGFRKRTAAAYRSLRSAQNEDAGARAHRSVRERFCPHCGERDSGPVLHRKHGLQVVACARCPMVYSRVILTEEAERSFYSESGFQTSYLALKRNEAYAALERRKCAYLVQQASRLAPQARTCLEIGCGVGRLLQAARAAGWRTVGVEPNPGFAAEARRQGLEVLEGWFPHRPGPEHGRFDVIAMLDVLEHAAEPVRLLVDARERLAPGGLLLVQVPNFNSLLVQLEGDASPVICQGHWNYFTAAGLAACAERAGLKVLGIETLLTELDRIEQFPVSQVQEAARRLAGGAHPPRAMSPEWLHEHLLGFKLLGMFKITP